MKVAFIGGGNMAGALIGGMLDPGLRPAGAGPGLTPAGAGPGFDANDIDVLEIDAARRAELVEQHRVAAHHEPGDWLNASEVVVLAVKPQQMQQAVTAIASHVRQPLLLSIAAGVRAQTIAGWLATDAIVRAMPNMPALIGAGITGAVAAREVSAQQKSAADKILSAVGAVIWLDDESMLDAVTAISGSGPAYVFYFIEAMQAAARELGFDEMQARALTVQTFVGAAQLAARSSEPIGDLREKVTSKGGTTAAAIASFNDDEVKQAIVRAIHAANRRAAELGG